MMEWISTNWIAVIGGAACAMFVGVPMLHLYYRFAFRRALAGFAKTTPATPPAAPTPGEPLDRVIKAVQELLPIVSQVQGRQDRHHAALHQLNNHAMSMNGDISQIVHRLSQCEMAINDMRRVPPVMQPTVGQSLLDNVNGPPPRPAVPQPPVDVYDPPYNYTPPAPHTASAPQPFPAPPTNTAGAMPAADAAYAG